VEEARQAVVAQGGVQSLVQVPLMTRARQLLLRLCS
jgi:hypothetical protein